MQLLLLSPVIFLIAYLSSKFNSKSKTRHSINRNNKTSSKLKSSSVKKRTNKRNDLKPVCIKTHKDQKGGHPHIIIDDIDNKHISVGLTHDMKKGKNSTNYGLEYNPLGGSKKSYMHRQGTVDNKKSYYGERTGQMTIKDYNKAIEYGEKAKQKYFDKNK